MIQRSPELRIRSFFLRIDRILRNRKIVSKWQKGKGRERYNKYKNEYMAKHGRKWMKKWRKENPVKNKKINRLSYYRTRSTENIFKNRENVNKWKKENAERTMQQMVRHYKKYGKELGKPWDKLAFELLAWSDRIKTRDEFICQVCGNPAIHAHHILYKRNYPKFAFSLNNGIALCKEHHREAHSNDFIKPEGI